MAAKRLLSILGATACLLAILLPSGNRRAFARALEPEPMPEVASDQVLVRFTPEVGPYFVRVVDLVLGLKGACETSEKGTWAFTTGDRGTRDDYALLFSTLPYVKAVTPQPNTQAAEAPGSNYVEGELLVKFKPGVTREQIDAFDARYGVSVMDHITGIDVYRLKLPAGTTVDAMRHVYEGSGLVVYAEPNHRISVPLLPNLHRRPKPAQPGTGSVDVRLAPGSNLDLINLVYGTHTLGSYAENGFHLAPAPKASALVAARILKLCPSVLSATPSS